MKLNWWLMKIWHMKPKEMLGIKETHDYFLRVGSGCLYKEACTYCESEGK